MSDATDDRAASSTPKPLYADTTYDDDRGDSWVVFAGIMLSMVGILNIVYGIAAIDDSTFFTANAKYVITDLNTWGWVALALARSSSSPRFGIWAGVRVGPLGRHRQRGLQRDRPDVLHRRRSRCCPCRCSRVDILVIYGLVAYGGHRRAEA